MPHSDRLKPQHHLGAGQKCSPFWFPTAAVTTHHKLSNSKQRGSITSQLQRAGLWHRSSGARSKMLAGLCDPGGSRGGSFLLLAPASRRRQRALAQSSLVPFSRPAEAAGPTSRGIRRTSSGPTRTGRDPLPPPGQLRRSLSPPPPITPHKGSGD